ncbi:MAG: LysR family transcriptional regulator [Megasphaera sp.]|uniref:LysR family transcriptional regulator n=1 Tax=Megasphaera sueciensis TaxID=349094 RepID=UPI002ACB09ED|nr:LysR family transcriptional regulator [Megasphaera sp.]MCI1822969.1 LysR family transcriptional regulator [Megasphaera sp.]
MLDFRIHTFLCVCRHMNYTKAAAELRITQPAVSQHIRYLEKEYGAKLFSYTGKHLALTQAGHILLNAAATIRHDDSMLKQRLQDLQRNNKSIAMGATHTIGEFCIVDKLARFLNRNPNLNLRLEIADTEYLLKLVDEGKIDFAIVEGFFEVCEYDTLPFAEEPLIAVCGPDYPAEDITVWKDLLKMRIIIREKGAGARDLLERHLAEHNLTIEDFAHRVEAGSPKAIKEMVSRNCGVAFLYEHSVRRELEQGLLRQVPIRHFNVRHAFSFLWRKGSMHKQTFKDIFKQLKN